MKPFDDLTQEELIALTDEQISYYVDLHCAEEGIRLLPPRPTEPIKISVSPDLTAWKVDRIELYFLDKDKAEEAQALLLNSRLVDDSYTGIDDLRKASERRFTSFNLTPTKMISAPLWDQHQQVLEEYKTKKNIYNCEIKDYQNISEQRSRIARHIYSTINEAQDFIYGENRMKREWETYLKLAEGDTDTARKFMLKAYPDCTAEYPALHELMNPVIAKPA